MDYSGKSVSAVATRTPREDENDDECSQEKANIIFSINTELIGARESVRERAGGRIVK